MKKRHYQNPFPAERVCWPIVRRRVADEILDLCLGYMEMFVTRGKSLTWNQSFPNRQAYHAAVYRLRKAGLIACRRGSDRSGCLVLTEEGRRRQPPWFKPMRLWTGKWSGTWHVLVYDVPEKRRGDRDALRGFLSRMRMGCLQRSVYVSPCDVRPEYGDLCEAAGIQDFSFLFEARTVMGRRPEAVVEASWDFEGLEEVQREYCEAWMARLHDMRCGRVDVLTMPQLARDEMVAYTKAMRTDPLLPETLHPSGYLGKRVYGLHCQVVAGIASRLI